MGIFRIKRNKKKYIVYSENIRGFKIGSYKEYGKYKTKKDASEKIKNLEEKRNKEFYRYAIR